MDGVTAAIVGFIFVCLALPNLVKRRPQYYMAVVAVLLVVLFDAFAHMSGLEVTATGTEPSAFQRFMYVACAFMQIIAIVLLILSTGGLTVSQFAGEMHNAYEVMRRGEEEKEVIIPINKGKAAVPPRGAASADEGRVVYQIDPNDLAAQKAKPPGDERLPLE